MNILSGRLNKKKMVGFLGVPLQEVDKSLTKFASIGWLRWNKEKGGMYDFTLFSEPVRELELSNDSR